MKTPKYLAKVVQKYLDITIDLLKKKRLNFKNVKLNEVPKKSPASMQFLIRTISYTSVELKTFRDV